MPPHSETPQSSTRLTHLRSLDGLRGVAVLAVILYHFSPGNAPGGFLGVDVFFVLSGFLITSLLVNEWESNQRISLRHFWVRRARRLLPALIVVLAAVGVYALVFATEANAHRMAEDGLAALGYVANWHFIASGQAYVEQFVQQVPSPLRHTWSLAIEEQFYLAWPLVVAGIAVLVARTTRRERRPGRGRKQLRHAIAATCVALGIASLALMVGLFNPLEPNRVYYGTDTRAFLLLLGAAIGALTAGGLQIARAAPRSVMVVGGCIASVALTVAMATVETTDTWLYKGGYGVIAILIAAVLVAAAQPGLNPLRRVLESRALVGLGLISYGVYLWHWPITVWLTEARAGFGGTLLFALRAVLTLATSLASYWLIEQPIRQGRLPSLGIVSRRVVVVTALAAVAALLLFPVVAFSTVEGPPRVGPSASSAETTGTYATVPRCDKPLTTSAPVEAGVPPAREMADVHPRVQIVGNSVAVELVPCLTQIVESQGGALESVTHSAAPPCTLIPALRKQVENPKTKPDIAIWFAFDWFYDLSTCNTDWLLHVQAALDIWKEAGVQVYLVPIVPNVIPSGDPLLYKVRGPQVTVDAPAQTPEFRAFAEADPDNVTLVDPGLFVRDAKGTYQWRMPCLPGGEPGCDADGTIGVRYTDGFHLCTDPAWDGTNCSPVHAGGARRVTAAVAWQLTALKR